MTLAEIASRVRKVVSEELAVPLDEVLIESRLVADLDADSLDLITLPFEVEVAFDIEFTEDEADTFKTVGDIVARLAERLGLAEAA